MWDVRACRGCLTVKGKLEKIGDASKRQYSAITGLSIADGDGYPNYFCVECRHHIRKSLAFRRKSRRAHFVLKEIMSVRKQVTYSDIVTVNRKKTNLESSLNFWEPHNSSCYTIANDEEQQESLQKYNLEEVAQSSKTHSKHLIDIKPDIDTDITDIPDIPEETLQQEDDGLNNDDAPVIPTDDYLEPPEFDTSNIDMNDIFKDLKTEDDDDLDFELPPAREKKKENASDNEDNLNIHHNFSALTVCTALMLFKMKALSLSEQIDRMELRKKCQPFWKALYKCAMCLTIHKNMPDLVAHVQEHNKRKYDQECQVCKNKFPTQNALNRHVANCHLYEYQCAVCDTTVYCQKDAVIHAKAMHSTENNRIDYDKVERKKRIKHSLTNFTITTLSQKMMSDVMLLKSRPEHNKEQLEPGEMQPAERCPYKCDICGRGFKQHTGLEKHMVLKHRYMYTCKQCKEVFTTRHQALEHNEKVHGNKHTCPDCGRGFSTMQGLKYHVNKVHAVFFPCNLCGFSTKSLRRYYMHQLREHGYISLNDPLVGDPQHKCSECEVQFADKRSLDTHLVNMNHAGADSVEFACVPCKKIHANEDELETHFITCEHSKKYPRKCCYCSEMLHDAMSYKMHYIREHPTLQYRYVSRNSMCDVCGKLIFRPMLEAHRRAHESAGHACRRCPALHYTAAQHVAHVLANHARRPFRCALCPRGFRYRADCKDHVLQVHQPTKLFKCEFCAEEFSFWRNLKEHSESAHNLVIPPIRTRVLKTKDKIFVYAHMKIVLHELEREKVAQCQVELIDYLEQKSKPVDYENYFIFSPDAEETGARSMVKRLNRPRKKKTAQPNAQPIVQLNAQPIVQLNAQPIAQPKTQPTEIESAVAEISHQTDGSSIENDNEALEVNEGEPSEEQDCKMEIDESAPLEVIENEGHQFVMIDGEMYRIACEDDE